jgi:transcription initiation factor TFIID subunit 7
MLVCERPVSADESPKWRKWACRKVSDEKVRLKYPHGLTPPLRFVRRDRFRKPPKSESDGTFKQVETLLQQDAEADGVELQLFDEQGVAIPIEAATRREPAAAARPAAQPAPEEGPTATIAASRPRRANAGSNAAKKRPKGRRKAGDSDDSDDGMLDDDDDDDEFSMSDESSEEEDIAMDDVVDDD